VQRPLQPSWTGWLECVDTTQTGRPGYCTKVVMLCAGSEALNWLLVTVTALS
jgi:hypothetical protein